MSHCGAVHVMLKQFDPFWHFTSHAHELLQDTPFVVAPPHDWLPEHVTSHTPGPHCTLRHVPNPLHSTLHAVPAVQSTPMRHELGELHLMLHEKPGGHLTSCAHVV